MRLFVALRLPAALRRLLSEKAARLRPSLPPARWAPVDRLHLTLRFLGETEPRLLAALDASLAGCFGARAPFRLRLTGGGTFPPGGRGRVAWVGCESAPRLLELQAAVAAAIDRHCGPGEARPFHPHLTLARPRKPWPRAAVERWDEAFAGPQGAAFEVSAGHLMRSHLGPNGASHESLGAYSLAAAGQPPV